MRPSTTCSLRLSRFHEFHAVLKLPTTRLVLYWTWLDALHDVVRRHAPPKDTEHIGISSENEEPRIFTRFPNAMFTLDSQKGNLLAQVLCVKSFVVLTCVHLITESFWTQEKKMITCERNGQHTPLSLSFPSLQLSSGTELHDFSVSLMYPAWMIVQRNLPVNPVFHWLSTYPVIGCLIFTYPVLDWLTYTLHWFIAWHALFD